ncbi:universal stress protein [Fibrella aquatica]|uniref:universal stress protein n=1 Tax=Fibrella aquatica TaxID=3242487 RepID=UPI0035219CF0
MKKILVTTDYSANSKSAIRFAIQLASQGSISLTFLHILHLSRPTTWHEETYLTYEKEEIEKDKVALDTFINSSYEELNATPSTHACVVEVAVVADFRIMGYAEENDMDFICISTRGAGMFEKIIGTTTANLINQSSVPVIAVPGTFRTEQLTSLLYASDFTALKQEIPKVVDMARVFDARVDLLHFSFPSEPTLDPDILNTAVKTFTDYPMTVHLKPTDLSKTLIDNIDGVIKTLNPSLVIMFTTQNLGFFHQLFSSGNSVNYCFLTSVPLLVFAKS